MTHETLTALLKLDTFLGPLNTRLKELGIAQGIRRKFLKRCGSGTAFYTLALDAAARMAAALVASKSVPRGRAVERLIDQLLSAVGDSEEQVSAVIPEPFWLVSPSASKTQTYLRAAVLLSFRGGTADQPAPTRQGASAAQQQKNPATSETAQEKASRLASLAEDPVGLWQMLRGAGSGVLGLLLFAAVLSGGLVALEALLFRLALELPTKLQVFEERATWGLALLGFSVLVLVSELVTTPVSLALGRRVELKARSLILQKLPTLSDGYFRSRIVSDLAERMHASERLRAWPDAVLGLVQSAAQWLATMLAILILVPELGVGVCAIGVAALLLQFLMLPLTRDLDMRAQTGSAAVNRSFRETLLGSLPIRLQGAQAGSQTEHDMVLDSWLKDAQGVAHLRVFAELFAELFVMAATVALVVQVVDLNRVDGTSILGAYWALQVARLGAVVGKSSLALPSFKNVATRLFEILDIEADSDSSHHEQASSSPVAIDLQDATVAVAGHNVLKNVSLSVQRGEHVAIVGASGAGKSTLLATLLGLHRSRSGQVLVDGATPAGEHLWQLRKRSVWVAPDVYLWQGSVHRNLSYGNGSYTGARQALEDSHFVDVLERQDGGLGADVGEGGGRLSSGEAQRLRIARGLLKTDVDFVFLDEFVRGLDHEMRLDVVQRCRERWRAATLVCVTHDMDLARTFSRVIVMKNGRIVEDDAPAALLRMNAPAHKTEGEFARLCRLFAKNRQMTTGLWRTVALRNGKAALSEPVPVPLAARAGGESHG